MTTSPAHRCRTGLVAAATALALATSACLSTTSSSRPETGRPALVEADTDGFYGTAADSMPRPVLVLRDTEGRLFDLRDRPRTDAVTVLFFGYTHCDDVCPTTMADLASARRTLPPDLLDRVEVVFVTDDPARDTPTRLRRWLDRFDPSFIGLIGGGRRSREAARALYAPVSRVAPEPDTAPNHSHDPDREPAAIPSHGREGDYEVDHSGTVYAFAAGEPTVFYTGGTTPLQYAADLRRLLGAPEGGAPE